jgi:hypothetical protein
LVCTIVEVWISGGGIGGGDDEDIVRNPKLYLGTMLEPYRSIYKQRTLEDTSPQYYSPGEDGPITWTVEQLETWRASELKERETYTEVFEGMVGRYSNAGSVPSMNRALRT